MNEQYELPKIEHATVKRKFGRFVEVIMDKGYAFYLTDDEDGENTDYATYGVFSPKRDFKTLCVIKLESEETE